MRVGNIKRYSRRKWTVLYLYINKSLCFVLFFFFFSFLINIRISIVLIYLDKENMLYTCMYIDFDRNRKDYAGFSFTKSETKRRPWRTTIVAVGMPKLFRLYRQLSINLHNFCNCNTHQLAEINHVQHYRAVPSPPTTYNLFSGSFDKFQINTWTSPNDNRE